MNLREQRQLSALLDYNNLVAAQWQDERDIAAARSTLARCERAMARRATFIDEARTKLAKLTRRRRRTTT